MTREEYARLLQKHPKLNPNYRALSSPQQKPAKGEPLDGSLRRKDSSRARFEVCFTIYSRRPCDWDNYHTKCLQDLLIKSGILYGDEWDVLQGKVISKKVSQAEEEKTVIEINPL